jgi:3',5'-cyclic-nucleotide phosphodiesterase
VQLQILGGHQVESIEGRATSFLIDGSIAIDAGGLTGALTLAEQGRVDTVLITHYHFDHITDLPFLGLVALNAHRQIEIHCTHQVHHTLVQHMLNGVLWPNLFAGLGPTEPHPTFIHRRVTPGGPFKLKGYEVLPIENRHHPVPVTGNQFTSPTGKRLCYTGDTGPGIRDIWPLIQPDLLITEVTVPDAGIEIARMAGHLSPSLLEAELRAFQELKGYLPRVVICHVNQANERQVVDEVAGVADRLRAEIEIAREGMQFDL